MQLWRQGKVRGVQRVACPLEADALVLAHLLRLGCDPDQPRECRHYLYVPGEFGARAVTISLNADGYDADYEEVHDAWLVIATRTATLSDDSVRETREQLEDLAAVHGGEYDGWEAAAD